MLRWFVSLALIFAASSAHASGSWSVYAQSAVNCSGGCTANAGSFNGTTVPRCTNGSDGACYFETEVPNFCGSTPTVTIATEFVNTGGTGATGNVCAGGALSALGDGADADQGDWTFNTLVYVSKALTDCKANNSTDLCVGGETATTAIKNLGTGSDCATTACNKRTAILKAGRDTGASCASDSSTSVDLVKFILTCN